eukprot:Blabericola_migrator_1__9697@NODE_5304_length_813_cov_691_678284_g2892_i2_p1_GENE_NODE_5304_length_813_cov_691_678284_g2892_i2NODE_5304_length_813_cov_691_678284_g2892_i2_p1_ORF_typecomplete_len215_score17_11_NODE_5304_length_813_cov_691_678284_g2892_i252696
MDCVVAKDGLQRAVVHTTEGLSAGPQTLARTTDNKGCDLIQGPVSHISPPSSSEKVSASEPQKTVVETLHQCFPLLTPSNSSIIPIPSGELKSWQKAALARQVACHPDQPMCSQLLSLFSCSGVPQPLPKIMVTSTKDTDEEPEPETATMRRSRLIRQRSIENLSKPCRLTPILKRPGSVSKKLHATFCPIVVTEADNGVGDDDFGYFDTAMRS